MSGGRTLPIYRRQLRPVIDLQCGPFLWAGQNDSRIARRSNCAGYGVRCFRRGRCHCPAHDNFPLSDCPASLSRTAASRETPFPRGSFFIPARSVTHDPRPRPSIANAAQSHCRPATRGAISDRVWWRDSHPKKRATGMVSNLRGS
jgi:hypothetical protein